MRGRLLQLDVENFRSLRNISVPLGDLTVLVGPNGVGKTNVLKVFDFLADIIRTDLEPALEARGGFDEVAFWGGDKPPTTLRIRLKAVWTTHASARAPDEYELTIRRRSSKEPRGYSLSRQEKFQFKRTKGRGRRITIAGERAEVADTDKKSEISPPRQEIGIRKLSSGLSTLPRLALREGGEEVSTVTQRLSSFRVFDMQVPLARRPARLSRRMVSLADDAGNLADFLRGLRHSDLWEPLVDDARAVLPQLRDIELVTPAGAAEEVTVVLHERGLRHPTPLRDASYGTVRLLGLLALLYDPAPPALTCVEEIDHGLHPQALELLVQRLREASQRSQYIVATHSPTLVDRLEPSEFVVCERHDSGASVIPALSTERVERIVAASEDLPLGELWFSGVLGGDL